MTTAPISLQDRRRRLYVKAKAERNWRVWGLYVQVGKLEMLRAAYDVAKQNNGAPGSDGVTFEAIEDTGVEAFLAQFWDELVTRTDRPLRNRRVEIPKGGDKVRVLPHCVRPVACDRALEPLSVKPAWLVYRAGATAFHWAHARLLVHEGHRADPAATGPRDLDREYRDLEAVRLGIWSRFASFSMWQYSRSRPTR